MADNQNTTRDVQSVRTRDISFTNIDEKVQCALELSFNDDMVRVAFTPPLPESERGEKRYFDYQHSVMTALSRVKIQELLTKYQEVFLPKLLAGESKSISVPVGNVNQFGISTGYNLFGDGECYPYAFLIRGISPETLTSADVIMYVFRKSESLEDYDPKTGEYGSRNIGHAEFYMFIDDLKEFKVASSKAYVHAARCVDRAYKDMISNNLQKLMEHAGIEIPKSDGTNRNVRYGSIFGGSPKNDAVPANTSTYTSFEDLANALG